MRGYFVETPELCAWLRENSSGIYRPAAEAADRIERLENALKTIIKIENKAGYDEIEEAREIATIALDTTRIA